MWSSHPIFIFFILQRPRFVFQNNTYYDRKKKKFHLTQSLLCFIISSIINLSELLSTLLSAKNLLLGRVSMARVSRSSENVILSTKKNGIIYVHLWHKHSSRAGVIEACSRLKWVVVLVVVVRNASAIDGQSSYLYIEDTDTETLDQKQSAP